MLGGWSQVAHMRDSIYALRASMPLDMGEMDEAKVSGKAVPCRPLHAIKCVVYDKANKWFRNRHTLGFKIFY